MVAHAVEEMLAVSGRYDQEARRLQIATEISTHGEQVAFFAAALTDHDAGRAIFGEKLPEARYLARYVARASARDGREEWVVTTLRALGTRVATGSSDVGERTDFEDLLTALVEGLGHDAFARRRRELLEEIGYAVERSPAPLRRSIRAAVRTAVWRARDLDEAEDYVNRLL